MNISIKCEISLSKKLRTILGENGSVILNANNLRFGKGIATLSMSSDNEEEPIIKTGETSIILAPVEIIDNVPTHADAGVGSIFTTTPNAPPIQQKQQTQQILRNPVDRIAVTQAPETQNVPRAMVPREELRAPEIFQEANAPQVQAFVRNLEELREELLKASTKVSNINPEQYVDPRARAIAMQNKEQMEAIDVEAWIVNESAAMLTINDLNISLPMFDPYNLANIAASRVARSGELRGLVRAGVVRFCNPNEVPSLKQKAGLEYEKVISVGAEDAFGSVDEAADALSAKMNRSGGGFVPIGSVPSTQQGLTRYSEANYNPQNIMDISSEELMQPTAEQSMILNLTQRSASREDLQGIRTSMHGNAPAPRQHNIPIDPNDERTIRKKGW